MHLDYETHAQAPATSRGFGHNIVPPETVPGKNVVFGSRVSAPSSVAKTLVHAAILLLTHGRVPSGSLRVP